MSAWMPKARALPRALLVAAVILLAAGGAWGALKARAQQARLAGRLAQTDSALEQCRQTLTMLEGERQKLSSTYETLKQQLAKTEAGLQEATQSSTRMGGELSTLSGERANLQARLTRAEREQQRLQAGVQALQQDILKNETEKTALAAQLHESKTRSLTPMELGQLAATAAAQRETEARLQEQLQQLSRAYEQLALAEHAPAPQPAARASVRTRAERHAERQRLAGLYRTLGESYLATHQYPKAAQALEQSAGLHDDPVVHAKLAFIYGRILHDPEREGRHAALAGAHDPALTALAGTANAYGLPRKSWRLVWQWLTQ